MSKSLEFFLTFSFLIYRLEIIKTTFQRCCQNQILASSSEYFVDSEVLYIVSLTDKLPKVLELLGALDRARVHIS